MKLYATTRSERATKGQGGNDFLEIIVQAEKLNGIPTRANLYRLTLRNDDGELYADLLDFSIGETIILTNDKAKKQKGEKCQNCNPSGAKLIKSDCLTCGGKGWL